MQLDLFQGPHVPLIRCLAALEEGDVCGAREALGVLEGDAAAADRTRLGLIEARLPTTRSADEVHATFEAALAAGDSPGEIPSETWFKLYARHLADALHTGPAIRFRGWCALHFELAAGRTEAALRGGQRLVSVCDTGWASLEAARAAFAAGEAESAARLVVIACLREGGALDPDPPRIAPGPGPALTPPPGTLPRLPRSIEDLWDGVERLQLPGPASAWVPAVGIIDGIFSPSLLGWSVDLHGSGFDPIGPGHISEPPAREFIRALLAARHARAVQASAGPTTCGDAELAARRRMRAIAPALLARYLARLDGAPARR
jgi:hypothetical protein